MAFCGQSNALKSRAWTDPEMFRRGDTNSRPFRLRLLRSGLGPFGGVSRGHWVPPLEGVVPEFRDYAPVCARWRAGVSPSGPPGPKAGLSSGLGQPYKLLPARIRPLLHARVVGDHHTRNFLPATVFVLPLALRPPAGRLFVASPRPRSHSFRYACCRAFVAVDVVVGPVRGEMGRLAHRRRLCILVALRW